MLTGWLCLALLLLPDTALSLEQVDAIVKREFQGLLRLGAKPAIEPLYLVGDFNGDGAQDLVAVTQLESAKPARKPGFRLYPPGLCIGGAWAREVEQDTLTQPAIAVLHGDKKRGWEKISSRQKHVILGSLWLRQPLSMKLYQPGPEDDKALPLRTRGTTVLFMNSAGVGSALYWNGSCYDDYPLGQDPTKSR